MNNKYLKIVSYSNSQVQCLYTIHMCCALTYISYPVNILSEPFTQPSLVLTTLPRRKAFENIVGNGENAGNQHFLHFPQCFLSVFLDKPNHLSHILFDNLQIWTSLKFFVKRLMVFILDTLSDSHSGSLSSLNFRTL